MKPILIIQSQLLATKFYVPTSPGTLIRRPRLSALLDESLKYPLTLISAPAGFGKTTLLSTWAQFLPATQAHVAWLSLDEEENDPQLFWTYVLSALDQLQPERFTPLLKSLQSPVPPPLMSVLVALIESVQVCSQPLVLILDDYHVISGQQVHATLWYLIDRLPSQLHLILATRADPPLPLSLLRERRQVLEVRTEQLRCTREETKAFLHQAMGTKFPYDTIQEVTARTEGWMVGLQLLALSLQGHADPATLLEETCGNQRYILDYLTEVVLHQQPPEVQRFLLCTCIFERLSASLCDAVMEQTQSQAMLEYLERANLFVVSLDSKRQWYRYHGLFAEALRCQLERTHADLVPVLHTRASHWYAQHQQTMQAILHAFEAKEWHWAADLIEQAYHSLVSFTWGANRHALVQFQQWIERLPAEILTCRPHFCLACVYLLWPITPHALLSRWLDLAEMALGSSLEEPMLAQGSLSSQEQKHELGKVMALRAYLQSPTENGSATLALGEQALALLSPENGAFRAIAAIAKAIAYYTSSANDAMASITYGYQAIQLTQEAREPVAYTFCMVASTASRLIGVGRLHETVQLTQQALKLEEQSGNPRLPERGWVMFWQAEILREWNELDAAHSLATEAISLCEQAISTTALRFLFWGYAVLTRICLSRSDLDGACTFLQQAEKINQLVSQQENEFMRSYFTTVDQVRLWLACGELDRATHWAEALDMREQHFTPFARERQEVARARILLAQDQSTAALQRLEPALQRATAGQRWGHVIEIRLLQALAYQKLNEEPQALSALAEAVRLGEPERYIRSFVEEGEAMADLLRRLRQEQRHLGLTAYLDTLLAAFAKEDKRPKRSPKRRPRRFP